MSHVFDLVVVVVVVVAVVVAFVTTYPTMPTRWHLHKRHISQGPKGI